jgi:serine/threonine protein kinase
VAEPPIGYGAFGVVSRATWRGACVAVKKLLVVLNDTQLEQFLQEAKIMECVSSQISFCLRFLFSIT